MARFLSPRSLLLTRCRFVFVSVSRLARLPHAVHSHQNCPLSWCIPSRTLLGVCRESSPSGLSPLPDRRQTKPGRTPDSTARGGNGPDSASTRNPRQINTFTRRAPYSARREPISSRRPATALFSVVTNKLPKVAVQLPIGDDVSPPPPGAKGTAGFELTRQGTLDRQHTRIRLSAGPKPSSLGTRITPRIRHHIRQPIGPGPGRGSGAESAAHRTGIRS